MRVLIAGGDGYLGWPTAMRLSSRGYQVAVADNYLRRNMALQENVQPLFSVPTLEERIHIWKEKTGNQIELFLGDLTDWTFVSDIFGKFLPDVIIHYAEQPSAPYSMLNRRTATLTLNNNLNVTANMIFAVKEYVPDAHLIKLGTMGEYGTPNIDIEEGWIDISHKGRSDRFLYPRQAGSLYHTTKIMDTDLLWYYVRVWGLKVTDLMQGPVYGLFTDENIDDERLLSFFSYDEIFGTVINRFVVQAVIGYPLTVYGKGEQTRGYINIKDTLNCVTLALENPPEKGELRILNQYSETFSVNELADKIKQAGKVIGLDVEVKSIVNPRKESEDHYYNPANTGLKELGLQPYLLTGDVLSQMMRFVLSHKDKISDSQIVRGIQWD